MVVEETLLVEETMVVEAASLVEAASQALVSCQVVHTFQAEASFLVDLASTLHLSMHPSEPWYGTDRRRGGCLSILRSGGV